MHVPDPPRRDTNIAPGQNSNLLKPRQRASNRARVGLDEAVRRAEIFDRCVLEEERREVEVELQESQL